MKKLLCVFAVFCLFLLTDPCGSKEFISYSSASSLKYELNSLQRSINNNNYKIRNIQRSKNLSDYEKKRQIQRLEYKNRYLERDIYKIKRDYRKAIS